MNRKQRRAAQKQGIAAGGQVAAASLRQAFQHQQFGRLHEAEALCRRVLESHPHHAPALHLLGMIARDTGRFEAATAWFEKACRADAKNAGFHRDLAAMYFAAGRLADAATHCRRALALQPGLAEVHNNLGAILMAQGDRAGAAPHFERAVALTPELFDTYADVLATFYAVHPAMREAVADAARAWPTRLALDNLAPPEGVAACAENTFLMRLLESHTVCDIDFERFLTTVRYGLLGVAEQAGGAAADERLFHLSCALARQCFLNEYVFALAPDEAERVDRLKDAVIAEVAAQALAPLRLAVLAAYVPLGTLPVADDLVRRNFPAPLAQVVVQQIHEPRAERNIREKIPRLTAIADQISDSVRQQYEENPYPRWVDPASRPSPEPIAAYLRRTYPFASLSGLFDGAADALIAGCGTGWQSVDVARRFVVGKILAVDLSAASLAFAIRKTRELSVTNIEYAQADLLELAALGRRFDFVDSIGVLHHLADPFEGWRILLSLLRPAGVMRIGLYSETGRRAVLAARQFIAERNYTATAEDIRRCRQDLIETPLRAVAQFLDFFSVSECRDLLFHVQEHRLTLPVIKEFLAANKTELIGFELAPRQRETYRRRFPNDRAMTNLDNWHAVEQDHPDTFASMYQFWIAKR
jgi:Tfp pilus assembly protein PilF/SAM-dependent methyltransferase